MGKQSGTLGEIKIFAEYGVRVFERTEQPLPRGGSFWRNGQETRFSTPRVQRAQNNTGCGTLFALFLGLFRTVDLKVLWPALVSGGLRLGMGRALRGDRGARRPGTP